MPTMVSQINPLFHTSTVRPKSRRLISLPRKEEQRGQRKMSLDCRREERKAFTLHSTMCTCTFATLLMFALCHVLNVHMVNKCRSTYIFPTDLQNPLYILWMRILIFFSQFLLNNNDDLICLQHSFITVDAIISETQVFKLAKA